jgi:hypothetical protein
MLVQDKESRCKSESLIADEVYAPNKGNPAFSFESYNCILSLGR